MIDDKDIRTLKHVEPQEDEIITIYSMSGMEATILAKKVNAICEVDPTAVLSFRLCESYAGAHSIVVVANYNLTTEYSVEQAPELSKYNRDKISCGVPCGCYFCFKLFDGQEIEEWTDIGNTALCPHCGVDAVIVNVDDAMFLVDAGIRWFTDEAEDEPIEASYIPSEFENKEYYGRDGKTPYTAKDASTVAGDNLRNINAFTKCGCYSCLYIFEGKEITEFVNNGLSARCPACGHNTVIPESVIPNATTNGFVEDAKNYSRSLTGM